MWTLVSFTEIATPLAPYPPGHVVGIVENDDGEREIVQVEGACPYIGMKGDVRRLEVGGGMLNFFVPEAGDS